MNVFEQKVYEFCQKEHLLEFGKCVVGVSGGPDSVALLRFLAKIRSGDITAMHVNHNLRPVRCDEDEAFVKDLCESLGVELKTKSVDIAALAKETGESVETCGRRVRYDFFKTAKADVIAVAHHRDDLAETMLMNLFRGSGLEGLVSPRPESEGIIRPFLCVSKDEILEYLTELGQPFCTDDTNYGTEGTRNTIRNVILPAAGDNSRKKLAGTYELLKTDLDYLESASAQLFEKSKIEPGSFEALDRTVLRDAHPALLSRVIRKLWKDTFGNLTDFETVNLDDAKALIEKEGTDGTVTLDMPFGRKCYLAYDVFGFCEEGDFETVMCALARSKNCLAVPMGVEIKLKAGTAAEIPDSGIYVKCRTVENKEALSYNKFSRVCPSGLPLVLRNDASDLCFSGSSKKLKRRLSDEKVPEAARKYVLTVTAGDEIVWVPGMRQANPDSGDGPWLEITIEQRSYDGD